VSTERIFTSWMPAALIAGMFSSTIICPASTMTFPSRSRSVSAEVRPRIRVPSDATTVPASRIARMLMPRSEPQSFMVMIESCATSTRRRVR